MRTKSSCLFWMFLSLGADLLISGCSGNDQARRGPRFVFLVSLDTRREDRLGLYGYGRATTPHLAKLAEESVCSVR